MQLKSYNYTLIHQFQATKFNVIMPKLKLLLNLNYKYPVHKTQTSLPYLSYDHHLHSQK
jgi:hypothetical protein